MSNPTIHQIHQHRSFRKYKPDPLSVEMIEQIVAAGQRASTSSNLQTYSVVVVTEAGKRERLAELCGQQAHIAQAPVFMAWCADLSRLGRACELRGYAQETRFVENFLIAAIDAALAMQNATLAAELLGLGMCYIGGIRNNPDQVIELLELPPLVFPVAGMSLGWPVGEPLFKPRLPLRSILHWERYDRSHEDEDLLYYDREMAATGIYHGRQVPAPGQPDVMEAYGWLEHSARRASGAHRIALRRILEESGFALE